MRLYNYMQSCIYQCILIFQIKDLYKRICAKYKINENNKTNYIPPCYWLMHVTNKENKKLERQKPANKQPHIKANKKI